MKHSNHIKVSISHDHYASKRTHGSMSRWQPGPLHPLLLAVLMGITILLMAALLILQVKSKEDGGIFFAPDINSFDASQTLLYRYLPTVVAVCYSTFWSWVDLNVKRLEPWFQLSKTLGAAASESLFLDYPAEFFLSVPFTSFRRRHWLVFCSSVILVILSLGVVPLQSGIFVVDFIQQSQRISTYMSSGLAPLEKQIDILNLNFVDDGYGIAWLDQQPPAFTTTKYGLKSFAPSTSFNVPGSGQTVTAITDLYTTNLNCRLANAISVEAGSGNVTLDDGQGCVARDLFRFEPGSTGISLTGYFIGFYGDGTEDDVAGLQAAGCSPKSLHEFMVSWYNNTVTEPPSSPAESYFTAMFCRPIYYTQTVEATVYLSNFSVSDVRNVSEQVELAENVFNSTLFEQLIVTQVLPREAQLASSPQTPFSNRVDISDMTAIDQTALLQQLGVQSLSPLTGFALGMSKYTPGELVNPAKLQEAFEDAYRMLFALAIHYLMQVPTEQTANGTVTTTLGAVFMAELFTYLVIGLLGTITLLTLYLLWAYRSRSLLLDSKPDSIASIMSLVSGDKDLLSNFYSYDEANGERLMESLAHRSFKLHEENSRTSLTIIPQDGAIHEGTSLSSMKPSDPPSWPWQLRFIGGGPFVILITACLVTAIVTHKLVLNENGLPMVFQGAFTKQLLLNFVPTALGTLAETFWTSLNRLICAIQPFTTLNTNIVSARNSLLLEYTSMPPQLAVWNAAKAQHWLLATICFTTVVANVLTVGLSGFFDILDTPVETSLALNVPYLPKIFTPNSTSGPTGQLGQPLSVMLANITQSASLPPWTTSEYYMIPADLPQAESSPGIQYRIPTVGIGASLDCQELQNMTSKLQYRFLLNDEATEANFTISETLDDGTTIRCYSPNANIGDNARPPAENTQVYLRGSPEGQQGVELFIQPLPSEVSATAEDQLNCPRLLVAGWVRSSITLGDRTYDTIYGPARNITSSSTAATFIMCKPRFEIANFDVSVDPNGYVLDYVKTQSIDEALIDENLVWSTWNATTFLVGSPPDYLSWHNDTVAGDWMNLFMKEIFASTSVINPLEPAPEFSTTAALASRAYSELFAVTMQSNKQDFVPTPPNTTVMAQRIHSETRIFIVPVMYYIVLTILAFDIAVAVLVYARIPKPFLPRMPTSIAALIPYFAASHVIEDLHHYRIQGGGENLAARLDAAGRVYGFGRYMGTDGNFHMGIDRHPYLVPRLESRFRKWAAFVTPARFRRKEETFV